MEKINTGATRAEYIEVEPNVRVGGAPIDTL
jgi:hypothetical protein